MKNTPLPFQRHLIRMTSPKVISGLFGCFLIYALVRYFFLSGGPDELARETTLILLVSQFALLASFVVAIRAVRDERLFESAFALLIVVPAISIATTASLNAAYGIKSDLGSLVSGLVVVRGVTWEILALVVVALGFMAYLHLRRA